MCNVVVYWIAKSLHLTTRFAHWEIKTHHLALHARIKHITFEFVGLEMGLDSEIHRSMVVINVGTSMPNTVL